MNRAKSPDLRFLMCYDAPEPSALISKFEGEWWALAYTTKELAELFVEQAATRGMALVPLSITEDDVRLVLAADVTVAGFIVDPVAIGPKVVRLLRRAAFGPDTE